MARGRGFLRLDNGDGTYTYQKRTASGLVEVSEDEWRRHCKTFHGAKDGASKKRPADDNTGESQRNKTKLDEVEVTCITLKDGKVIEEKKEKARRAKDGTLHLTDDDGASKKRPAEDGAEDSQRLKRTKSLMPETAKPSGGEEKTGSFVKRLETWVENQIQDMKTKRDITFGFLVDGDGDKDLSPEKVKERLELLESYAKTVTAQSLILSQQNDTLKKENLEIRKKYNKVLEKENELLKELTETTTAHNELDDMLYDYQQAAEVNKNINVINVKNFKEAMAMVQTLFEEKEQLKAQLERLNPQEL